MQSQFATLPTPLREHADRAMEAGVLRKELTALGINPKRIGFVTRSSFTIQNYKLALGNYVSLLPREKRSPSWLLAQTHEFQNRFWKIFYHQGPTQAALFLGAKPYTFSDSDNIPAKAKNQHSPIFLPESTSHSASIKMNGFDLTVFIEGKQFKFRPNFQYKNWKVLGVLKDAEGNVLHASVSVNEAGLRRILRCWIIKNSIDTQARLDVYPLEVLF